MEKVTRRSLSLPQSGGAKAEWHWPWELPAACWRTTGTPIRAADAADGSFGLRHPFVGAGMGFVALPALAGGGGLGGRGLGVLGVAPEPPPVFAERLTQIRALTSRPFPGSTSSSPRRRRWGRSPSTITSRSRRRRRSTWSSSTSPSLRRLGGDAPAAGSRIWVQVPTVDFARQALAAGADGLVVQGKEAGGHNRSTTPLHHLLRDIRQGARGTCCCSPPAAPPGPTWRPALAHGADGVWVGTRLVASTEAYARIRDGSSASSGPTATTR